jgi:hypothetical protein
MAAPQIDSYRFGEIVIDGKHYTSDVIVFPDRIKAGWWREEGHSLSLADLDEVLREPPEVLIIGLGADSRMDVPAETRRALERIGIRVMAENTGAACQSYNHLRGKKTVVAALHLTC